tara:strand:- start:496 stop:1059 length:564 start_codon:yes stop_codon:yes gene_type:complete
VSDDEFYRYDRGLNLPQVLSEQVVFSEVPQSDYPPPLAESGRGGGGTPAPWALVHNTADGNVDIFSAILVTNVLTGVETTVSGLSDLALGASTTYWLTASFTSGAPTGWSVTTTGPAGDWITWDGSDVQTGLWYLLGRVVAGPAPNLPGFDFQISETDYHLEQLCFSTLFLARLAVDGKAAYYPRAR